MYNISTYLQVGTEEPHEGALEGGGAGVEHEAAALDVVRAVDGVLVAVRHEPSVVVFGKGRSFVQLVAGLDDEVVQTLHKRVLELVLLLGRVHRPTLTHGERMPRMNSEWLNPLNPRTAHVGVSARASLCNLKAGQIFDVVFRRFRHNFGVHVLFHSSQP